MTVFLTIFWVVFGILYIAWNAHKECPGSVLLCTGVVGAVVSVFILVRGIIFGAYQIHEALAIAVVALIIVISCVLIAKIIAKIYKDNEPFRIAKEIETKLNARVPTDAELEEAILDPFFDSFYRTEKVKRMTFLNPDSSMYYKTSHITREKAYRSWKRIQIQRGLDDRLK